MYNLNKSIQALNRKKKTVYIKLKLLFIICYFKERQVENRYPQYINQGFPGGTSGKEHTYQCRRCKRLGFDPWVGKRAQQPIPVFLSGESHGQSSLAGYGT